MEPILSALDVLLIFFIVLVAATVIERLLEFVSIILEYITPFIRLNRLWYAVSTKIQQRAIQELSQLTTHDSKKRRLILNVFKNVILKSDAQPGEPVVIQVDAVRKISMEIIMHTLGIIIGILLAWFSEIDILKILQQLDIIYIHLDRIWSVLLTGIILGTSTGPIHSIIRYAENKKESQKREVEKARLKAELNN